jgi:galactokinase
LRSEPAVFGAKMTGAGFGGACVALCASGLARDIAPRVLARYNQSGPQGSLLVPPTARGLQGD